jgi:large subunit ribosomal protein L5
MRVGIKVTLRSKRMWDFWDRLVNLSLPRIRDFRGISANSFDGNVYYNLGIREHIIFPEIDYGKVDKIRSFQITVATSAKTDQEGYKLLQLLGMPFMEVNNG